MSATSRNLDDLPSPKPPGRRKIWVWIMVLMVVVIVAPLVIRLGEALGWWGSLLLLKLSAEPQQVVSVVGGSKTGVLMTIDHRGVREITILISDTLHIDNLSQGIANNSQPMMSPEGDRVAFMVGEAGAREIKIAPIQGHTYALASDEQIKQAAPTGELKDSSMCDDNSLSWSPDGTHLAFMACVKDKSVIVTVDTQTKEVHFVPHTDSASKRSRSLAWLDDARIVFVEQVSPDADQVFVINVDGRNKTLVFSGP
jgi:hypothetical protein